MVQANKKLKKQQYVYDYDRRKTKKISNICLHLIKKLNDRSGGYIFARELKYEIERILNIRLSDKTIAKYRLKTLKMNFRRARFQPKIFNQDELDQRLNFALNLKRIINSSPNKIEHIWSSDESSCKTGRHNFYHHRLASSRPKCARPQLKAYKMVQVWAAISTSGPTRPAVFTENLCKEGYELIIKNFLIPSIQNGDIVLQDNSSVHNSYLAREAMLENNINIVNIVL